MKRRPALSPRRRPLARIPARSAATRQRGAALLTAMVIVTLVATMSASMVWSQWRAVQVETAERARTQSAWILSGALDWARLILKEDLRTSNVDHLGEPWAVPLAEARLSTFLAADKDNNADDDSGPEAFLSGRINDMQAHYNLHNVVNVVQGQLQIVPSELIVLENLCEMVGVAKSVADALAGKILAATPAQPAAGQNPGTSSLNSTADSPLMPQSFSELSWFGIDPGALRRLKPYVMILPVNTQVNMNTAPPEVLAAVLGTDLATAQRLVEVRQRKPFTDKSEVGPYLGNPQLLANAQVGLNSDFFEVHGRLRLGTRVLEEVSLVERQGRNVLVRRRERVSLVNQ